MAKDKGAYGEGVTRFKVRFRAEDKLWIAVIQLCSKEFCLPRRFFLYLMRQEESPTWRVRALWVTLCLCFKTSPCRKLSLIWKWVLFAWKWTSRWNSFPYEWYRMKTQMDRGKSQLSWSDLLWEGCIFLEPAILMTIFCWYCKKHELKWFSLQMACYFNFCIIS